MNNSSSIINNNNGSRSSSIRPIAAASVRKIVAGQAVTDLASTVKELVDNAIDAQSKNINIRLFQQGLHIIEVSDDGCGVPPESRRLLATPHATSKIRNTDEIGTLFLGFRGEALFSLATLSEKLVIATRVQGEELAEKLEFRRDGTVDEGAVARFPKKIGTTVAVVNLFAPLPVRRGDFQQRLPQQRAKLVRLVESYAIFYPHIRFHLMDILGRNGREQTLVATATAAASLASHNSSVLLQERISSVFGPAFLASLCSLELTLDQLITNNTATPNHVRVLGMISMANHTINNINNNLSRQLVAVNQRPVELPKLSRLLNAAWKQQQQRGNGKSRRSSNKPSWCLNLTVPVAEVDVNLTPDKRTVLFTHEEEILKQLVSQVERLWASQNSGGTFHVEQQQQNQQQKSLEIDYDSPNGLLEKNETLSPSRFNRRYAFSHDVSKVRLQHQFDDGRQRHPCQQEAAKPAPPPFLEDDDATAATTTAVAATTTTTAASTDDDGAETHISAPSLAPKMKRMTQLHIQPFSTSKQSSRNEVTTSSSTSLCSNNRTNPVTPSPVTAALTQQDQQQQLSNAVATCSTVNTAESSDTATTVNANTAAAPPPSIVQSEPEEGSIDVDDKGGEAAVASAVAHARSRSEVLVESVFSSSPSSEVVAPAPQLCVTRSPAEERRWRAMQRAFNHGSSTGMEEDLQAAAGGTTTNSDDNDDDDKPQQFGFAQFGLNQQQRQQHPSKKVVGNTPPVPASSTATSTSFTNNKKKRRVSDEVAVQPSTTRCRSSSPLSPIPPPPLMIPQAVGTTSTSTSNTALMSRSDVTMMDPSPPSVFTTSKPLSSSPENIFRGVESAENDVSEEEDEKKKEPPSSSQSLSQPSVVWDSFGTTQEVILAARRERLALRGDRKRRFQPSSQPQQVNATTMTTASSSDATAASGSQEEEGDTGGSVVIRLSNDDFTNMKVIGQFNLGFILALDTSTNNLWILDQHACDEKYNFEKLCAETVIHEQPLLVPLPLELSPCEEMCVLDNADIFEKNGFRFRVDLDRPLRHRLSLTALPHSGARDGRKAVQFGKEDVSALCAILMGVEEAGGGGGGGTGVDGSGMYGNNAVRRHAGGSSSSISGGGGGGADGASDKMIARLPKAVAMFASRACRGSIMIGKSLSAKEMDRIIQRMKDLKDAWSCAHGRPTMRHVADLQPRLMSDERRARECIAGPTITLSSSQLEYCEES